MKKCEEIGVPQKPRENRVKIALVYPNYYKVGMSSLGFQTLYRLLNEKPHITCERVFLPEAGSRKPLSLENSRDLADFDFVFFSVSYSADFINIFEILKMSSVNPDREARKGTIGPVMGCGGSAVFINPEPLAPVFDFFLLGEGESFIEEFARIVDGHPRAAKEKEVFLEHIKKTIGVYIPANSPAENIIIAKETDINSFSTASSLFTQNAEFGSVFMEEISRGCARGCRFCAIGYIGKPYRTRDLDNLEFSRSGSMFKVGLLGAAISDHPRLKEISRRALDIAPGISFSSFRIDKIDSEIAGLLAESGIKTFTIAPEAGSRRLRKIINKDISDEDLCGAVRELARSGIKTIKLYFMIGLPMETDKDIEELISLIKKLSVIFNIGIVRISINTFVPKPHTPFQWFPIRRRAYLDGTFKRINRSIKLKNVRFDRFRVKDALIDAILSKGDRDLGYKLIDWCLCAKNIKEELLRLARDDDHNIYKELSPKENLPWDFIDIGISKDRIINEYIASRSSL